MNRILIEQPYVMQLSFYVQRFQWVPNLRVARFRCPVCGDSQKNQAKTRGYIYINPTKRTHFNYKCHNCGYNNSFLYFLKDHFPSLYNNLKIELMKEYLDAKKHLEKHTEIIIPDEPKLEVHDDIKKITIDMLDNDHPAKKYCIERSIPTHQLKKILYVNNFKDYIDEVCPDKYERMPVDERILFELRTIEGELVGVQGRIIVPGKKNRFLTLKFDDSSSKIYGLEHVNKLLPVIVTEGIIDSFFLDNAIALTGGDVVSNLDEIIQTPKSNIYIALDNEPRNVDTVHRMELAIKYGYKVFFWNVDTKYKDINDMVQKGNIPSSYIQNEIITKSLSGFSAKVAFNSWKRV